MKKVRAPFGERVPQRGVRQAPAALGLAGLLLVALTSRAQPAPFEAEWTARVERIALQAAHAALGGRTDIRVEVQAGRLDPRLKLAPCNRVDFYLPPGQKAWGSSRVGVRCLEGATRWNVYMPLTVRVFAPAMLTMQNLAAGTTLAREHLQLGQTDWAAAESAVFQQPEPLLGRSLARALPAGAPVREADLRRRQWFAVGDPVRVVAQGAGFNVSTEGVALSPGVEGQLAKVRTEGGRTLTGIARSERKIEVQL